MANLELIKQLNIRYQKSSPITRESRAFSIDESFDPEKIGKVLPGPLGKLGTDYLMYFELGCAAEVVLLFIDVCSFSSRYANFNGKEIGKYFDSYYDIVIPLIYKYGGEVEKIIGDGIICVFGPPFQSALLKENISKADLCAKEIIKMTKGTDFSSKIAMHNGMVNYYTNKTGFYKEFTMIGKPLTELFRLESISINERINYFGNTNVYNFYENKITPYAAHAVIEPPKWTHCKEVVPNLKGVNYSHFFSIKYSA